MTVWPDVEDEDSKPSVEFTPFIHTPIAKSENKEPRYMDWGLSLAERIEIVNLYAPAFELALASAKFTKRKENYGSEIIQGKVPEKYLMNYPNMKAAFSMGRLPKPEDLPEELRKEIWTAQ